MLARQGDEQAEDEGDDGTEKAEPGEDDQRLREGVMLPVSDNVGAMRGESERCCGKGEALPSRVKPRPMGKGRLAGVFSGVRGVLNACIAGLCVDMARMWRCVMDQ